MNRRSRRRLLALMWGIAVVVTILSLWLVPTRTAGQAPMFLLLFLAFGVVGILIVDHQPRNPVGWTFLGAYVFSILYALFNLCVQIYLDRPAGAAFLSETTLDFVDAYFDTPTSYVVWGSMYLFPVLYLPDGELLSRRWRYLVWAIMADFILLLAAGIFYSGLESALFPDFRNPLANPVATRIWEGANLLFFPIYGLAHLSLVMRFRRARGVERQQVKWSLFSALIISIAVALYFLGGVLYGNTQDNPVARVGLVFEQISVMSFPITVGMAILRYRLYDIDIIIRRTLQYTLVSGILALIYFGVVTQLEGLLRAVSGQGSPLAVVISTLGIAALFNPLRKRVQAFIDRRFYRQRYDVEKVLASFSASLRDEVNLDELTESILEVVDETMQPANASLWLRDLEES